MARLEARLRRLEGQEREEARVGGERAAQRAASAEALRTRLDKLAERSAARGDAVHDLAALPIENVARAMARGDMGRARELIEWALERREGGTMTGPPLRRPER